MLSSPSGNGLWHLFAVALLLGSLLWVVWYLLR